MVFVKLFVIVLCFWISSCSPKLILKNTEGTVYIGKPELIVDDTTCSVLYGKVIDAYYEKPLPHSIVSIENTRHIFISDTDGCFSICIPRGSYVLKAINVGNADIKTNKINIKNNEKIYIEFRLGSRIIIN